MLLNRKEDILVFKNELMIVRQKLLLTDIYLQKYCILKRRREPENIKKMMIGTGWKFNDVLLGVFSFLKTVWFQIYVSSNESIERSDRSGI